MDFPLFSTILNRLGLLSTYLRRHRVSVSSVNRVRFQRLPIVVAVLA